MTSAGEGKIIDVNATSHENSRRFRDVCGKAIESTHQGLSLSAAQLLVARAAGAGFF
jgi:hypothetical protein